MKILITTHHLRNREGSELFTINLAKELKKRQHDVFVFSPILGAVAEELKNAGIPFSDNLKDFAAQKFDLIHAQHNTTAILARSVFPSIPMVVMLHGILPELEQPPSIDLGIEKYLVISEEIKANIIKKYSIPESKIEIVRNFVDTEEFSPIKNISSQPKNLLVVSNRFTEKERNIVMLACKELGLNYSHIGLPDNPVSNVNDYINQSDIVITLGRGALEAMSCARNVIIFDIHGGDGFVDEKSFFEIRKNNFSGRRYARQYSQANLITEIKKYDPSLGSKLREIVVKENSIPTILNQLEKIYQIASQKKVISSQITKNQLYLEINFLEQTLGHQLNYQSKCYQAIEEKQTEINSLTQKNQEISQALTEKEQKIINLTNDIDNLRNSTSWKITKLLRIVGDLQKNSKQIESKKILLLTKKINRRNIGFLYQYLKQRKFGDLRKLILDKISSEANHEKGIYLEEVLNNFLFQPQKIFFPFNKEKPIDIIIPVFAPPHAFHFLNPLFDSLIKNTSLPYRLIIVDEKNEDQQVQNIFAKIIKAKPNTILIKNKEVLGFVRGVNKAMQYVKNHFVILNMDTEVPPNWLERLMYPILFLPKVATVTPFTNSGTICSFPNFAQDNLIFAGLKLEKLDQIFQYVKTNDDNQAYIELPTGVGFCMAVNKNVLDKIGLFDEKIFLRGYGEENDWCQRAIKKGFRNVLVPNLFIYHKHGGSFTTEEKKQLMRDNYEKLCQKHPEYPKSVQNFIQKDPARNIRPFVAILAVVKNIKAKKTIIIDHELGGGSNAYRDNLIKKLITQKEIVFLLSKKNNINSFSLNFFYQEYHYHFLLQDLFTIQKLSQWFKFNEIVINGLVSYDVMKTIDWILDLQKVNNSQIKILIHDYLVICPNYVLLNPDNQYCRLPAMNQCAVCLKKINQDLLKYVGQNHQMSAWRAKFDRLLRQTNEVICFSQSSKDILSQIYPNISKKIKIIPHQVDYIKQVFKTWNHQKNINVGILGSINQQKGLSIIKKLLKLVEIHNQKNINRQIKIIIIGTVSKPIINNNLVITGKYLKEELENLTLKHQIDVFIIPSIGPETFSYTAEEIIKMNMPLVVFDIGAPAERIKKYSKGKIVKDTDASSLLKTILEINFL